MKDKIILYATIAIAVVAVIMFMIYPVVFYTLIGVAGFLAIVYLCSKYKWARVASVIVGFIALIGGTIFSYIKLDEYYTATGGVFGKINDFFGTNTVEVDNLTFNFSDIQLKDSGNQTDYVSQTTKNVKFNIDLNKNYSVYVNETPCTFVEITQNYIRADFTYIFQDDDLSELMTDTLKLRFAFNNNYTQFNITTSGGMQAVNRWNYYFEKNGFTVKVEEAKFNPKSDMEQTDGQVEYALANFYVDGEIWMTQLYHINEQVSFPFPEQISTTFKGWSLDYENIIEQPYNIRQHTNFYAVTGEELYYSINYKFNEETIYTERVLQGHQAPNYTPDIMGYQFLNWQDESGETFDYSQVIDQDRTLTANCRALPNQILIKYVLATDTNRLVMGGTLGGDIVFTDLPDHSISFNNLSGYDRSINILTHPLFKLKMDSYGRQSYIIEDLDSKATNVLTSDNVSNSEANIKTNGCFGKVVLHLSKVNAPMTIKLLVEPIYFSIKFQDDYGIHDIYTEPEIIATVDNLMFGEPIDLKKELSTEEYNKLLNNVNPYVNTKTHKFEGWFCTKYIFDAELNFLLDYWDITGYAFSSSQGFYPNGIYYDAVTHTFTLSSNWVEK